MPPTPTTSIHFSCQPGCTKSSLQFTAFPCNTCQQPLSLTPYTTIHSCALLLQCPKLCTNTSLQLNISKCNKSSCDVHFQPHPAQPMEIKDWLYIVAEKYIWRNTKRPSELDGTAREFGNMVEEVMEVVKRKWEKGQCSQDMLLKEATRLLEDAKMFLDK
ncbi:hypothetical protein K440DRAFT_405954 [Wilcoxina mikolae CBS 423.85]|nr:hypothetical protein K440DRAFT_405954 [Wilcoxina mikolae CBS 423.85]